MALSVSWLDARLNKEAKETVVKADRDGLSARVSPKGKIVFQFRYLHILSSFDHPIALTLIAYSH